MVVLIGMCGRGTFPIIRRIGAFIQVNHLARLFSMTAAKHGNGFRNIMPFTVRTGVLSIDGVSLGNMSENDRLCYTIGRPGKPGLPFLHKMVARSSPRDRNMYDNKVFYSCCFQQSLVSNHCSVRFAAFTA